MDDNAMNIFHDGTWISEILDTSNIGLWVITFDPRSNIGRMFGNATMLRLLGIAEPLSPEKTYWYWFSRIEKTHIYHVRKVVKQIIDTGQQYEAQYPWNHPALGRVFVRCGGKLKSSDSSCVHLRGYHQDITEIENIKKALQLKNDKLTEIRHLTNEIEKLKEHYHRLAYMDTLTGLPNRRSFFELAISNISQETRDKLWIIMADIDLFKHVNDTYGHLAGDEVLREAARRFKDNLREHVDFIGRIGGEEFAFLISEASEKECMQIAERLRRSFAETPFQLSNGKSIQITCSFGVARIVKQSSNTPEYHIETAMQQADVALYRAKNSGRNKVALHPCPNA